MIAYFRNLQKHILLRLMLNDRDMAMQMNDLDTRLDELDSEYRDEQEHSRLLNQNIMDVKRQ